MKKQDTNGYFQVRSDARVFALFPYTTYTQSWPTQTLRVPFTVQLYMQKSSVAIVWISHTKNSDYECKVTLDFRRNDGFIYG